MISAPCPTISEHDRNDKYMNILSRLAYDIADPAKNNSRLAACVVIHNTIISYGVNKLKTHPFQAKYGRNNHSVFFHAETAAIKNALRYVNKTELRRATLYVCRVKYHDHTKRKMVFGLAKPCLGCQSCIEDYGIRKVIYSIDGNGYQIME